MKVITRKELYSICPPQMRQVFTNPKVSMLRYNGLQDTLDIEVCINGQWQHKRLNGAKYA